MILNLLVGQQAAGQAALNPALQDSSLNNLVLPADYKTGKPGELGAVKKTGRGKQTLILIAGWGFGAEVFDNFVQENKNAYTIYTVTPAGFGGTPAPPMPDQDTKYADNTWTRGIVTGVLDLIEKKKLKRPVIVAHFITATQAALDLALYHPEKIGKVVIMGGAPYRYFGQAADSISGQEKILTLEQRSRFTGAYADRWFKTVTKKTWDAGNHAPLEYSADPAVGQKLFDLSARVPVPVMVRYLLEFNAYDISAHYAEIKVPILILLPSFSGPFLKDTYTALGTARTHEWMKFYFLDCWDSMRESKNHLFEFQTIPNTRLFLWYDNPRDTYSAISGFIAEKE